MADQRRPPPHPDDDRRRPPDREEGAARARPISPTALGLPKGPIADAGDVAEVLSGLGRRCNLLGPVTAIDSIPPDYRLAFRVVLFDTEFTQEQANKDKSNGTFYILKNGGLALHASALRMLATAGAVREVPEQSGRTDDGKTPLLWRYRQTIEFHTMDGAVRTASGEKEVDLRDGSAQAKSMSQAQLEQARPFGDRLAMTKALSAAIRNGLCVRGGYTKERAALPFVIPTLVYFPPDTPEVRMVRALHAVNAPAAVYGEVARGLFARTPLDGEVQPATAPAAQTEAREDRRPTRAALPEFIEGTYEEERREREPARREAPREREREAPREERRPPPRREDEPPAWMDERDAGWSNQWDDRADDRRGGRR